jgi:hypothetical protein
MSLSVAIHDTTQPTPSQVATLSLWIGRPGHGFVDLSSPTFVARPFDNAEKMSWIDLRELGYAYQATAVAFASDDDWTSVTLCEALDTSGHPVGARYELDRPGLLNLFRIGWAARIGGIAFRR